MSTEITALLRQHKSAFDCYADLLVRWNDKINLTAITDPLQIEELHFADSLAVAVWLNVSRETGALAKGPLFVLDVGTGAGFPGVPLKVVYSDLHLTLVDAVKKKCDFLKQLVRSLSLDDATVAHDHLDEKKSIGQFDLVVSRAAFKLNEFLSIARPNLKPGGVVVAMKSLEIDAEIAEARLVLGALGYSRMDFFPYELPVSGQRRQLVVVR